MRVVKIRFAFFLVSIALSICANAQLGGIPVLDPSLTPGISSGGFSANGPRTVDAPTQGGGGTAPGVTTIIGADQPYDNADPNFYLDRLRQSGASPGFPSLQSAGRIEIEQQTDRMRVPKNGEFIEFQDFVFQSTGRKLNIYGQDLFVRSPSTFSPLTQVPVSPDYIFGPGDELVIRAWGQVSINYRSIVDRSGLINIPRIGIVSLVGVKFKDIETVIREAIGKIYKDFELNVTMGRLRSIQVFVVGNARRPGAYTISSLSTLVNALFVSGGPSLKGSMRRIQLKRGASIISEFDMYDLLSKGDKSKDLRLQSGDVIFIPPVGKLVGVAGSVNNQAIFEIKDSETLDAIIGFAGGLSATADGKKITRERISDRKTRLIDELLLDAAGKRTLLDDGDLLRVFSVLPKIENAITLKGAVARPGRYPWRDGMKVKDVLPNVNAIGSQLSWMRRNNVLREVEGLHLRDTVLDNKRIERISGDALKSKEDSKVSPIGVNPPLNFNNQLDRKAGVQVPDESMRAKEYDRQRAEVGNTFVNPYEWRPLADEINWDYAMIERINAVDLSTTLIPFNIGKAIFENSPEHNVLLKPGDILTIFSKKEIAGPIAKQTKFVKLEGEFNSPGVYQVLPGETLRQLVSRVGGVTSSAYLYGAEFTRERTRVQQQKRLDDAADRLEAEIRRASAAGGASRETTEAVKIQAEGMLQLAARLREVKATGRIVLDAGDGAILLQDLALENGDYLFVPAKSSTVSVIGAVYNQNAFIHNPRISVNDYLDKAGGATAFGDLDSTYVIRANGSVVSKRQSGWLTLNGFANMNILPGDTIVVPENLDRYRLSRELKDWTQIMYQFALGVAGLKVLRD